MRPNAAAHLAASLALFAKRNRRAKFTISTKSIIQATDMGTGAYIPDLFIMQLDLELRLRGYILIKQEETNYMIMKARPRNHGLRISSNHIDEYMNLPLEVVDLQLSETLDTEDTEED
ncbi:hypothetical protein pEaSNUABM14_00256 [Erwinia phage pEa_SNUABM_14]|uniref:Uncharacterized protein n=1 Tax=Erwinia phage pEa_SNUABM_7 TaxID=2866695 RepID=A0AAE7WTJ4_9CAUD|nr:hypothetical protein MPK74_gp257 [Erwinia phage pEa_SNUABM_7]QYW04581.1 hypothetical protein pEaSNUABM14_00256 [Erwinia phage pEa_SNUABM_14]QYW04925.1 hypothetical protein pEaSNUABM7_00257 [Erwinia phage pEa_SNUABM_7]